MTNTTTPNFAALRFAPPQEPVEPDLYTYAQISQKTGLAQITLRRAVTAGTLVPTRIGRNVRFTPQAIQAWIDAVSAR